MLTLKLMNNLESLFPNKVIRYFSIDMNTLYTTEVLTNAIVDYTKGYIHTTDRRNIKHCIFIFNSDKEVTEFSTVLQDNKIEFTNNKYTFRIKTFLNDLFNEYNYYTNIDL